MSGNKVPQEISVIGRFFSLEALVLIMGFASLINGLVAQRLASVLLGILLIAGLLLLNLICKRWVHK